MRTYFGIVLLVAAVGVWWVQGTPVRAQTPADVTPPPPDASATGVEVLTRGPIHEAYAQPVSTGEIRPLVVPKKAPEAIEELPPDAKPADENAAWIGGYWSWDDDRKDFLWISGVWRVPPPGQRWIAGYWTEAPGGFSWVAGFWSPAAEPAIEYYAAPPATLERGPTSDPPAADYVWVSGCWRWRQARYAWQPGYWAAVHPGWIWVPASYYWSPRGWVFCGGYWDYPLEQRGLIYAPIYFSSAVYLRPRYVYAPAVVIDASLLTFYLFTRPSYCHYYFGDYYAAEYDGLGIYPWFAVRRFPQYTYDPLFGYYNWYHLRQDPQWARNLNGWHEYYRLHADQRPPHDLVAQQRMTRELKGRADAPFLAIADTADHWRARTDAPVKLAAVSAEQKAKLQESNRLMRQLGTERLQLEAKGAGGGGVSSAKGVEAKFEGPHKVPLPKVAARLAEDFRTTTPGNGKMIVTPSPGGPPERGRLEKREATVGKSDATPQAGPTTSSDAANRRERKLGVVSGQPDQNAGNPKQTITSAGPPAAGGTGQPLPPYRRDDRATGSAIHLPPAPQSTPPTLLRTDQKPPTSPGAGRADAARSGTTGRRTDDATGRKGSDSDTKSNK